MPLPQATSILTQRAFILVSTGTLPFSIFDSISVTFSAPVDFKCITFLGVQIKTPAVFSTTPSGGTKDYKLPATPTAEGKFNLT